MIEGSLDIVFSETHNWYNFFSRKISLEKIYYLCLEALISSVKYIVHSEKPVFKLYVLKGIRTSIIKYAAKITKKSYRQIYETMGYYFRNYINKQFPGDIPKIIEEEPQKPTRINFQKQKDIYEVNYIKDLSNAEFMKDYRHALANMDYTFEKVMEMSYDIDGNEGLSNNEISDYLGINSKQVSYIRKEALKKLSKDKNLIKYL